MSIATTEQELHESFLQQTRNKLIHYAEVHGEDGLRKRMLNLIDNDFIDGMDVDEIVRIDPDECNHVSSNFGLGDMDDNRDLTIRNILSNDDIISGVLKSDTAGMFVGASKSYKTWHMIRMGLCVAHGLPWFGSATRKSKVLFINPELVSNEFQLRVQSVAKELNIGQFDSTNFHSLSLHKRYVTPDELMDGIEKIVKRDKYELVILDSLYRLYGRGTDENSNADMLRLMTRMEKMISNPHSAIVFSHHTPKGSQEGKRSIDMAAGGGLGRFVATCITTRILDEDKNRYSLEYTLRYHPPKKCVSIIAIGPKAELDVAFNRSELTGSNRYNNQTILEILAGGSYTASGLQKEVHQQTGMSRTAFYDNYWPVVKEMQGVTCTAGHFTYAQPVATTITTATS